MIFDMIMKQWNIFPEKLQIRWVPPAANTWHLIVWLFVEVILEITWKILDIWLSGACWRKRVSGLSTSSSAAALTLCLNWSHVDLLPISCSHNWSPDVGHCCESQGVPFELWKGPVITILASVFQHRTFNLSFFCFYTCPFPCLSFPNVMWTGEAEANDERGAINYYFTGLVQKRSWGGTKTQKPE